MLWYNSHVCIHWQEEGVSLRESLSKEEEHLSQSEADKQYLKGQLAEAQCELKQLKEKMTTKLQLKDDEIQNMKVCVLHNNSTRMTECSL